MSLRQELVTATNVLLSRLGSASTDLNRVRRARIDVAYEAFVFLELVDATARGGRTVSAVPNSQVFRVRRGPGEFWNAASAGNAPSYVVVRSGSKSFELHLDTYTQTRSHNAKLELDILAVTASHARTRRSRRERPSHRCVRVLGEVKCLTDKASTSEAKEFIGIADRIKCKRCLALFVSATELTQNARDLIGGVKQSLYWHERVLPIKACSQSLNTFRTFLDNNIPKAFS